MTKRCRYYLEPRSSLVLIGSAFFLISIILRLCWCLIWPENVAGPLLLSRGLLPLSACALFILCLLRWGKRALWLSFFPAFMGVLFFILKAADFVWWHKALCTILYLAVAALYGLTVFGIAPIKKLLIPLFGLPLTFHIFIEDLIINRNIYTPSQWVQELSVLCIMAGLLCVSIAMKNRA